MFKHKKYTPAQLMNFIAKSIPYSNHIDLISENEKQIIVKWRTTTFSVSDNLDVYEVKNDDYSIHYGNDASILFKELIKRAAFEFELKSAGLKK